MLTKTLTMGGPIDTRKRADRGQPACDDASLCVVSENVTVTVPAWHPVRAAASIRAFCNCQFVSMNLAPLRLRCSNIWSKI